MRHLITAALPYINGVKHLGNLVGSMLPADVYARWLRQRGEEVLFVCATDEHGAPAELSAREAQEPVTAYCARMHGVQADIYRRFGLSFDHFGRTSSPTNQALTRSIYRQLADAGYTERRAVEEIWSPDDGRFLADRYIEGTCPRCGDPDARGDQCDACGALLTPTELIDPRSKLSGSRRLERREVEHLFLKLSALAPQVRAWAEAQTQWPALTRQIAFKWLNEGLRDRGISRRLEWGVPVPEPGLETLVFYVWFDAPIGYIAATEEATGDRRGWWTRGADVRYTQFMGKDNLPFHTVMFPATLIGAGDPWRLPDQIKGFHWLNYEGQPFSTSRGRGVFTDAALALYPADYWRYALMAQIPEASDATFTWPAFAQTVNKDLAGVLGNFFNRLLKFSQKKFGSAIPTGGAPGPREAQLSADCAAAVAAWDAAVEALEMRRAMRALRHLWTLGNHYIDERAPWSVVKTDRDEAAMILRTCFNAARLFATAALPVIPMLAGSLLGSLGLEDAPAPGGRVGLDGLVGGEGFEVIPPAVEKILREDVEALEVRFRG